MAKFKVGDKVRIKHIRDVEGGTFGYVNEMLMHAGLEKVVSKVEPYGMVELEDCRSATGIIWAWDENWLEPVEESPKAKVIHANEEPSAAISLSTRGNYTVATLVENGEIVKSIEVDRRQISGGQAFDVSARLALDMLCKAIEADKPKFTKADLKTGMFGMMLVDEEDLFSDERSKWFVVVNDLLIYEDGGYDDIGAMQPDMTFDDEYDAKVMVVFDGALSFDNARTNYERMVRGHELLNAKLLYERK